MRRIGAFSSASALVFATAVGGIVVSGGTAAAASPVVAGSCGATVQGAPGAPLELSSTALLAPVVNVARTLDPLGVLGLAAKVTSLVKAMPNIPLGTVPAGDRTIPGSQVASAAIPRLRTALAGIPLLGDLLSGVASTLTSGCSVVVDVVNKAAAPVQDGTGAVAGAAEGTAKKLGGVPGAGGSGGTGGGSQSGGGGGTGGGTGAHQGPVTNSPVLGGLAPGAVQLYNPAGLPYTFGRSPMADYASLPFAQPGVFAPAPGLRYGGAVPGYSPQFGILGGDNQPNGVQAAGNAQALSAPSGNRVALPVLLAVLALSGVTAALVRTWVLRRSVA